MEVKSREEIMAERKLRKVAKQSKKQNSTNKRADVQPQEKTDCANEPSTKKQVSGMHNGDSVNEKISSKKNKDSNSGTTKPNNSLQGNNDLCKNMVNLKISETDHSSPVSEAVSLKVDRNAKSPATSPNVSKMKDEEKSVCDEKENSNKDESREVEAKKSKAQLKAERRAIQEAQRALKAQKKTNEETTAPDLTEPGKTEPTTKKSTKGKTAKTNDPNKVKMVSHLYLNTCTKELDLLEKCSGIHQSVIKLGLQYKHKIIIGSNARVVALLNTLKQVLTDFSCEHNFPREFEVVIERAIQYLKACRPLSVSMINAVKFLKWNLTQLPNDVSSSEAQIKLRDVVIADYLKEIDLAGKAISDTVRKKISQDDVILTFGSSSLIKRILKESFKSGVKFRVIIVDAGPLYEGRQLLKQLAQKGVPCTYVLQSAASYIMKEATKVLLGAHALLTNGYVMSRAGASQIALIARSYNVPVLVCCETHKFSERVQTDALVYNELGDPLPLQKNPPKCNSYMKTLTLMYDVTPSDLVTAVVTEIAILPCTSVPVVLRVKPANPSFN